MSSTDPSQNRSIAESAAAIRSGELHPVDLVEQTLARIEHLDPRLNAFNTVTADLAREQAAQAGAELAAGNDRGPLHGIPLGFKDLLQTAGIRTTASSRVLAEWIPDTDATVVQRLREAGAVCVGKTNMTEFALSGYHPDLRVPANPWNKDHWSGVSSSGSGVAVAAGLCAGAIGSDTGGSIRLPSAVNGIVGIKPTYGRVSRHGAFPLSESLDHIGPMAGCVEDAGLMLNAMAGFDAKDPTSLNLPVVDFCADIGKGAAGMRIGIDSRFNAQVDPQVASALDAVADQFSVLGASIVEVDVTGIEEGAEHWFSLTAVEALRHHEEFYPARAAQYGPVFASLLEHGLTCSGVDISRAYTARARVAQIMRQVLSGVDVLLCPSFAGPAPSLDEFPPQLVLPAEAVPSIVLYQAPFNFSGNPTISVPMGFSAQGLPLSLQLVARHGAESVLVQLGQAYEQTSDWHTRGPNID